MHILITGASGLIGKSLIHALEQRDYRISILSTSKRSAPISTNVKTYQWNPNQGIIDEKALDGVDVIISLAGAKINQRWTKKNRKAIFDSRVKGTQLIQNALKNNPNHNVSHFVSASAVGLYPSDFNKIYSESETKVAESFTGKVVAAWEQQVDEMSSLVAHVSKIRIGLVLAKSGGALVPLATPASFGLGAWFGSGKQWQSWIHIQDLVQLFVFAINHPGTYNGVSPNPVTQKQLVKAISRQYKMPQWMPGIPAFVIKAVMGKMANILFDSIRVSSTHVQEQGFSFIFPYLQDALKDLLPLNLKK